MLSVEEARIFEETSEERVQAFSARRGDASESQGLNLNGEFPQRARTVPASFPLDAQRIIIDVFCFSWSWSGRTVGTS